jgi:ABC-type uncharacterized transport system fused permease/ATPase subunit
MYSISKKGILTDGITISSHTYAAVDLRAHAEDIALYRGESYEKKSLSGLFNRVIDIWFSLITRQNWSTSARCIAY